MPILVVVFGLVVVVAVAQAAPAPARVTSAASQSSMAMRKNCKHGYVLRHGKCKKKKHRVLRPGQVKPGRYGRGDLYMEVYDDRSAAFFFELPCTDVPEMVGSSGLMPSVGKIAPDDRFGKHGAFAELVTNYTTDSKLGPGTERTGGILHGEFKSPTHFFGTLEFIVETFEPGSAVRTRKCEEEVGEFDLYWRYGSDFHAEHPRGSDA